MNERLLVCLVGLSAAVMAVPTDSFKSGNGLSSGDLSRFSPPELPSDPKEAKRLEDLESWIDEHLKQTELVLDKDFISESMGSKQFCELHKEFLKHMCSAMGNVKQMTEERKVACYGKEQELKDLHKLLVECAKTRVRLQKELNIYRQAVERAASKPKKSPSSDDDVEDGPAAFDKTLPTEPAVNGTTAESVLEQGVPPKAAPVEREKKRSDGISSFKGDLKNDRLPLSDREPASTKEQRETFWTYDIPEGLDKPSKASPLLKFKVN